VELANENCAVRNSGQYVGMDTVSFEKLLGTVALQICNKKDVMSQGNRAMPQLFFYGLKFADDIHSLQVEE